MINKKISVILPAYNGGKVIGDFLKSLKKQSFQNFELIIIDDASKDDTRKILNKLGYSYYKNIVNSGFVKTINKGIRMSKGDYILIMNQDMTFEEDYLLKLLNAKKDFVSSWLYYFGNKNKIRALNIKINLFTGKTKIIGRDKEDRGQFDGLRYVDAMSGGCFLVKREVFDAVGLFDEDISMYFADVDFCFRARKKGYKIFSVKARCFYNPENKNLQNRRRLEIYYADKKTFLKKYSFCYPISLFFSYLSKLSKKVL